MGTNELCTCLGARPVESTSRVVFARDVETDSSLETQCQCLDEHDVMHSSCVFACFKEPLQFTRRLYVECA